MKDCLIGINEGIDKLTLTLLIGIKADLLQFILYPDRLLKKYFNVLFFILIVFI